jgi:DMSO/TMAO reductase YedYZ molybdopterin-dependent catalytic subunit
MIDDAVPRAAPERGQARAVAAALGRRRLLRGTGLAALSAAIGAAIPFGRFLPAGYVPVALAQDVAFDFAGKSPELVVLGDKPLVAETPAHLLDHEITPTAVHYIRNNGLIPEPPADPDAWTITIDGEVERPLTLSLGELRSRFENVTLRLVLECGGNGRSQFVPAAKGNPWTTGGVGCASWTGVRLKDVLEAAGPKPAAIYTAHYGADPHLSGDPEKQALSRGVRLEKALEPHTLMAFAINGEPLPAVHGAPVRLIVPGWSGSASQKWLNRIELRDREHDGQGMKGTSYRVPVVPIVPGSESKGEGFRILESMPVKALITAPADGTRPPAGTRQLPVRGHAWAGDLAVREVFVSLDFGQSWQQAELAAPANRYAWQRWTATLDLPSAGYFEIWARAVDSEGRSQPFAAPNWNPGGYGGNAYHRIAVLVEA